MAAQARREVGDRSESREMGIVVTRVARWTMSGDDGGSARPLAGEADARVLGVDTTWLHTVNPDPGNPLVDPSLIPREGLSDQSRRGRAGRTLSSGGHTE